MTRVDDNHGTLTSASSFLIVHYPQVSSPTTTLPQEHLTPNMRTSTTSGPIDMCRLLIHKYSCGHSKTDVAPCAGQRGGGCTGTTEKTVSHKEKCARCGKCWCPSTNAPSLFHSLLPPTAQTSANEYDDMLTGHIGLKARALESLALRHRQWLISCSSSSHGPLSKLIFAALRHALEP